MRLAAALVLVLALALPGTARAQKGGSPLEFYLPLPPIVLEFWDKDGLFHLVNMELVIVTTQENAPINKAVAERIQRELAAIPWDNYVRDNPAPMIKGMALAVVKKEPAGEMAREILIRKLLFR